MMSEISAKLMIGSRVAKEKRRMHNFDAEIDNAAEHAKEYLDLPILFRNATDTTAGQETNCRYQKGSKYCRDYI